MNYKIKKISVAKSGCYMKTPKDEKQDKLQK